MATLSNLDAVDRFFRRKLSPDDYVRIRVFEPVIVDGSDLKRGIKYAMLNDRGLFLTENPPRKITEIWRFSDIRSIDVINDKPVFLKDDVGDRVQHIKIGYTTGSQSAASSRRESTVQDLPGSRRTSLSPRNALHPGDSPTSRRTSFEAPGRRRSTSPVPSPALNRLSLGGYGGAGVNSSPGQSPAAVRRSSTFGPQRRTSEQASPRVSMSLINPAGLAGALDDLSLDGEARGQGTGVMHIYTLSAQTTLLEHLEAAVQHTLIRQTLQQGDTSPPEPGVQRSETEQSRLFRQLMQEVTSSTSIEDRFELLDELLAAANRSVYLKRLFWQKREYYCLMMDELRNLLAFSEEMPPSSRKIELDYCVIVLEVLVKMLQESETVTERLFILNADRPYAIVNLLQIVLQPPHLDFVPEDVKNSPSWKETQAEIFDKAVELLFQLFLVASQAGWRSSPPEYHQLNIWWLVRQVARIPGIKENFVASFLTQYTKLLSQPIPAATAASAIALYHRTAILTFLVRPASALAEYLRETYEEEFRYLINADELELRLGNEYAINPQINHLLRCILASV
eukprot:m.157745 g.157745  ORF g.157745 m.157745 type:complete len:567 (+) comp10235_c0_seq1:1799-3499(+)